MPISNLEPSYLWNQFDKIRAIPHPSGHEEKIREYFLAFASEKGLEARTDKAGNVVIKVPATPGHENAPVIILQGHMDMVCEKNNDVEFDFMNDPIQLEVNGDWLKAVGTTLGADNGVGLAAGLALVDDKDSVHGPLEILATVDEETGLTGAAELDASMLEGKTLLNLDTEETGAVYVGCSGGGDSTVTLPVKRQPAPAGAVGFRVKVSGLRGGHSGLDIHEQRGNAIRLLTRMLWKAARAHDLALASFGGGGVHNAIPREAVADCVADASKMDEIKKVILAEAGDIKTELAPIDPGFAVDVQPLDTVPAEVFDAQSQEAALKMFMAIPHGVEGWSFEVHGLVETSNNLASVWIRDGNVVVGTSSRSSVSSMLEALRDRIRAAAELAGATVEDGDAYPGWKPDLTSKVLGVTKNTHKRLFGEEPEIKAIHAGLECGILGEKVPGMDMVSIGPQIEWPHSPDERVNIPSVDRFYTFLKEILKELA